MAVTRLSDAIVPEIFFNYIVKDTKQKMAFYQTGVLREDGDLANKLSGGGRTFNVPFWKDLDDTESDVASDDPTSFATPGKLGSGQDVARRIIRTRGWSTANLVAELAGSDPMKRISNRVSAYWARQFDDIALATLRGAIADNIANHQGDMVNDISTDDPGPVAPTNLFSAEAMLDTAQTMGDAKEELKLVVMHSVVQNRMAKNDLIDFRPDSEGKVLVPYFMDYRVHVSDRTTVVQGDNQVMYHSYLLGADTLGWAESAVAKPVETKNEPGAADGMGVEELWTRRQIVCHPYGIKFTDTSVVGEFPTNAELRLAANWSRVYPERKQIPISVLISNG